MTSIAEQHPFDIATTLNGAPEYREAQVSPAYQNMVGPFGGITAAKILQSVLSHPERQGTPISLTVNYLGPIGAEKLEIKPVLLRTNRSNQHWRIELSQGNEIQCSATCVLATRRDTWESHELECPDAAQPEALEGLPALPMLPAWVQQYDMRFIKGSPFEMNAQANDSNPSESLLWMADKPSRPLDYPALTALADAFFPRLVVRKKKMAPFGTVSLTIHFHVREEDLSALNSSYVLGHARASRFSGSYFDQTAELWSQDKQLLATTSQMVYYKD